MIGLRVFPLKSADVRGAGTRDEPLRTSAWRAREKPPLRRLKNVGMASEKLYRNTLICIKILRILSLHFVTFENV